MSFGVYTFAKGDVLAALRELPDNTFHGLLSDPPYGLKFMAKKWDYDVPSVHVWREALRVLRPGAALLAFGGTRTFHRMAVNIEDAGFELRDSLMWMYGKGFPKSLNVGLALDNAAGATRPVIGAQVLSGTAAMSTNEKGGTYTAGNDSRGKKKTIEITGPATELARQWNGYGTALKPGWEPIILARKPLEGTVANNVTKWGCGALAIDDCRLERDPDDVSGFSRCVPSAGPNVAMSGANYPREPKPDADKRWPANVALTHESECRETPNGEGCVDDCPIYLLNKQGGNRPSRKAVTRNGGGGKIFNGKGLDGRAKADSGYTDSGGPARFYYCAKVSTKEREFGCEALPKRSAGESTDRDDGSDGLKSPRAGANRGSGAHNHHPTLKPLGLTKWLASLIKPPVDDAMLLTPYSGAGSEVIGALQAGWPCVFGIEGDFDDAGYISIAEARIAAWEKQQRDEVAIDISA